MPARRKFLQSASLFGLGWLLPASLKAEVAANLEMLRSDREMQAGGFGQFLVDSEGRAYSDRDKWANLLYRMAHPVLKAMSRDQLKLDMKVEYSPVWDGRDKGVAYMEAFGRLFAGLAPWLSLPADTSSEGKKREELLQYLLLAHTHAVNPASKDYLTWHREGQPLVDAAFIAQGFLRATKQTWDPLDKQTKLRYIEHFISLRRVKPPNNNWLLFAAMLEVFLFSIDEAYDAERINHALSQHESWYVGDGWFKDGEVFHFDYYNSYVIHPMLVDILGILKIQGKEMEDKYSLAVRRMKRYAEFMERMISPEGSFPAFGRSITYRLGAFQPLSQLALMEALPEGLSGGQVRAGLTAVMQRMFSIDGNFNKQGYLTLGFAGHQPNLADTYSNSGSMYLTSLGFLHLGLPSDHAFWTSAAEDWTARKAWSGKPFKKDYAVGF